MKKPPPYGDGFSFWGLKKRGRKEDSHIKQTGKSAWEMRRLTASAAFLEYRIQAAFEQEVEKIKTNCKKIMKNHPSSACAWYAKLEFISLTLQLTMNNGQWTIKVFPTEIISNCARSAHHNCQLSIINCQFPSGVSPINNHLLQEIFKKVLTK